MTVFAADQERWIRSFHPAAGSHTRLFCFPYAGGAASYYFPFSARLTPGIEVRAIQYPGRQDRRTEPCIESIPELADIVADAVIDSIDEPYAFFGHSMGAIVAYEVAQRLQRRTGSGPRWLFASARRAPSQGRPENVHLRGDKGLVAELRLLGGTDPRWLDDDELLATILPSVRSDYRAIETYRHVPGPLLDCPITALIGDDDPYTTVDEMVAWREHSTGPFNIHQMPGGHFFVDTHRQEVIDILSSTLEQAPDVTFPNGSRL